MKKLRFDWLMFFTSIIVSGVCALICCLFEEIASYNYITVVLYSAGFLALPLTINLISIGIVELYRNRNYKIQKKGSRILAIIMAFVLANLLGGIGQMLYSLELPTWTFEFPSEKVEKVSSADISIMLDFSGSMGNSNIQSCRDAACELVDLIDENDSIQIIIFSGYIVNDETSLLKATKENKIKLKEIINNTPYVAGGTDFNAPLSLAYETLTGKTATSPNKAVIMLTDGDDFIDTQVYNNYISSKIPVYSICIDIATSKIEDLVNDSGGYSIPLNSDDIKNGELLKAFRDIYEEEIPHEEESDDSVADTYPTVICGNEDLSVLRVLIRLLVFALYVLLCSFCMYYTMNIGTVITALITSVITTLITCLTGSYIVVIPLFVLAFWIAMTRYYPLTFNE